MTRRVVRTTVLLSAVLFAGACGGDEPAKVTASAEKSAVTVDVELTGGAEENATVRATFTPKQQGFHLYSLDLPAEGVDGIGVPTRVEVRGGLSATGSATAGVPTHPLRLDGLDVEVPVYPDGPVTLTLPVRRTGSGQAEVVVSFGACSESQCLPPVKGLPVVLELP